MVRSMIAQDNLLIKFLEGAVTRAGGEGGVILATTYILNECLKAQKIGT